jgi:NAD(P)-dependent dehydrogenase (short-subunit alcohol dehydrogenase family)
MPLIRVNTISPGYTKATATANALTHPGMEGRWSEQNILNRIGFPDEFRGPIMFLLSDVSHFMTAADLRVDGGHRVW